MKIWENERQSYGKKSQIDWKWEKFDPIFFLVDSDKNKSEIFGNEKTLMQWNSIFIGRSDLKRCVRMLDFLLFTPFFGSCFQKLLHERIAIVFIGQINVRLRLQNELFVVHAHHFRMRILGNNVRRESIKDYGSKKYTIFFTTLNLVVHVGHAKIMRMRTIFVNLRKQYCCESLNERKNFDTRNIEKTTVLRMKNWLEMLEKKSESYALFHFYEDTTIFSCTVSFSQTLKHTITFGSVFAHTRTTIIFCRLTSH